MDSITYLFAANIAVWIGLGAYILVLALGQKRINSRITQLEALRHDNDR